MQKPFIDISIFDGVREFHDLGGKRWRFERQGDKNVSRWMVYRLVENTFIEQGQVTSRSSNYEKLYTAFQKKLAK